MTNQNVMLLNQKVLLACTSEKQYRQMITLLSQTRTQLSVAVHHRGSLVAAVPMRDASELLLDICSVHPLPSNHTG